MHSKARKKSKSSGKSVARWKHVSGKNAVSFEGDYSVAVGIAWQIKDLLTIEDARKALLKSDIEELFNALKVVSQTSILQASCCEYMDVYPVLAYTSLALHMALQNHNIDAQKNDMSIAERNILDQIIEHILGCTDELFQAGDRGRLDTASLETKSNCKQPKRKISNAGDDVSEGSKEKRVLNKVKMLTTILKFIVESTEMGLASQFQARMLKFTSSYLKYVISIFNDHSTGKLEFEDADIKDTILCTKSSISYAGKFINLVMRHTTETSHPFLEAFDLANDLLDLITMVEISLSSAYTSRFMTALNPWIPDLVLALGPCFINNNLKEEENSYTSSFNHIKLCFPTWLRTYAKIELQEINKEDETVTSGFPTFKRLINIIVSLVKGNNKVKDGIGYVLLICSAVSIEKKDFDTALGLLHFVCVKLVSSEDREWRELDTMLASLPRIYPIIEREIGEERDEDEVKKLENARELLQPVWMYHVYETGRFRMMEEDEEE